jgi:hypothetical protein
MTENAAGFTLETGSAAVQATRRLAERRTETPAETYARHTRNAAVLIAIFLAVGMIAGIAVGIVDIASVHAINSQLQNLGQNSSGQSTYP